MNHTAYSLSELDGCSVYNNGQTVTTNGLNSKSSWFKNTVEKEVVRGKNLRQEKIRNNVEKCDVMYTDFLKATVFTEKNSCHKQAGNDCNKYREKRNPCSPRSVASFPSSNSPRHAPLNNMWRPKSAKTCQRNCPMRIAELAVPSKRHCIDTWRNKYDVLPGFMMERLQQYVMDQRPIVDIPEAVYCFERQKSISNNSSINRMSNRDIRKASRNIETRRLCELFGQKIVKKLLIPRNIKLTSQLKKLSEVVADDIAKITRGQKRIYSDTMDNKPMHTEVSKKVAIWISNILAESSSKLLAKDLKVCPVESITDINEEHVTTVIEKLMKREWCSELEEEEGPVLDFIDDLVDVVMDICNPTSDFTEESDSKCSTDQRPVQEDNKYAISSSETLQSSDTLSSQTRESLSDSSETGSEHSVVELNVKKTESQESEKALNPNEEVESTVAIEDHIRNDIIVLIDNIAKVTSEENVNIENTKPEILQNAANENKDSKTQLDSNTSEKKSSFIEVINTEHFDETNESNDERIYRNVNQKSDPDLSEILFEDMQEDKNKKVKFSNINMVNQGENLTETSDTRLLDDILDELEQISWKLSSENIDHDIAFASPNENLLSDADESWPADIASPVLKASESVSKSVTSLGKILEDDEKLLLPEDDTKIQYVHESGHKIDSDLETIKNKSYILDQRDEEKGTIKSKSNDKYVDALNKLSEILVTDSSKKISNESEENIKLDSEMKHKDNVIQSEKQIKNMKHSTTSINQNKEINQMKGNERIPAEAAKNIDAKTVKQITCWPNLDSKVFYEDPEESSIAMQRDKEKYNAFVSSQKSENLKKIVDSKLSDGGINAAMELLEKVKEKNKLNTPKINYKVHLSTAPSWVPRGRGEPSDDLLYILSQDCDEVDENNIRDWGKDLDHGYESLEMWNDWINKTCKSISFLQKKMRQIPYQNDPDNVRKWLKLKEYIDKDVLFWIKFKECTQERQRFFRKQIKNKAKVAPMEHCRCKSAEAKRTQKPYKCRKNK